MRIFGRGRPALPADVAEALGVTDERVLAWSPLTGGGVAAATVEGLRIVTPRGSLISRSWVEVDHAEWNADSRMLAVWWVGTRQTTPLEMEDAGVRLPEVVRERVQASVVTAASVPLPGGRPARVALRKGTDGRLVTQELLPPGVRRTAPGVAEALAAATDRIRAEAGLDAGGPSAPPSIR